MPPPTHTSNVAHTRVVFILRRGGTQRERRSGSGSSRRSYDPAAGAGEAYDPTADDDAYDPMAGTYDADEQQRFQEEQEKFMQAQRQSQVQT